MQVDRDHSGLWIGVALGGFSICRVRGRIESRGSTGLFRLCFVGSGSSLFTIELTLSCRCTSARCIAIATFSVDVLGLW